MTPNGSNNYQNHDVRPEAWDDKNNELGKSFTWLKLQAELEDGCIVGAGAVSPFDYTESLKALIGFPPEGSHQDEWKPRADTWHQERLNWIAEVENLRAENERLHCLLRASISTMEDISGSGASLPVSTENFG